MSIETLVTAEGLRRLILNLKEVLVERDNAIEDIVAARLLPGDDTVELIYATDRLDMIEANVQDREFGIRTSIEWDGVLAENTVGFGSTVEVEDEDGVRIIYRIVGTLEIGFTKGAVSVLSPIAESMMGMHVGDEFDVLAAGSVFSFKIVTID